MSKPNVCRLRWRVAAPWLLAGLLAGALPGCAPSSAEAQPLRSGQPVHGATERMGAGSLDQAWLRDLVAPIARYPDDLLAIVLPASAYPLQIVQAARFLEARASDPARPPDARWDDTVMALLNHPEVLRELSEDLGWTSQLGHAVVSRTDEVIAAIEASRNPGYVTRTISTRMRQPLTADPAAICIPPDIAEALYLPENPASSGTSWGVMGSCRPRWSTREVYVVFDDAHRPVHRRPRLDHHDRPRDRHHGKPVDRPRPEPRVQAPRINPAGATPNPSAP